jgi:hypothetical protein
LLQQCDFLNKGKIKNFDFEIRIGIDLPVIFFGKEAKEKLKRRTIHKERRFSLHHS